MDEWLFNGLGLGKQRGLWSRWGYLRARLVVCFLEPLLTSSPNKWFNFSGLWDAQPSFSPSSLAHSCGKRPLASECRPNTPTLGRQPAIGGFDPNIFRFVQAGSEVSALLGRLTSAGGYLYSRSWSSTSHFCLGFFLFVGHE